MPWGSPSLFCFSNFSPFLSDSGSNGITTYLYYGHLPEGSSSQHRFLEQFTGTFTPELADHFTNLPPSPEVQARLDELGERT